jgi:hypothetical protein
MSIFADHTLDAPSQLASPPVPRSAGQAWVLSLVFPGAGQLYCRAKTRGMTMLAEWFGSIVVMLLVRNMTVWGILFRTMIMLYAFAGLDAYRTAVESNAGVEPEASDNPRVSGLLNMTTNGFGYIYLGWKFGFGTFLALMLFWRRVGSTLPLLCEAVAFGLAAHAYIGARKARREIYPETAQPPQPPAPDSRIPPALPWIVTGVVLGGYLLLIVIVQVIVLKGAK